VFAVKLLLAPVVGPRNIIGSVQGWSKSIDIRNSKKATVKERCPRWGWQARPVLKEATEGEEWTETGGSNRIEAAVSRPQSILLLSLDYDLSLSEGLREEGD
jgi:hypothetical protein